jgi:hypothetical protein
MIKVIENFVDKSFEDAVLNLIPFESIKNGSTRGMILRYGSQDGLSDNHVSFEIPELFLPFQGIKLEDNIILDFNQVSINVYKPGQYIGWHIDSPRLGPQITIISLMSSEVLQMKLEQEVMNVLLPQYSLMCMTEEHRLKWQHRLDSKNFRISIVFRNK